MGSFPYSIIVSVLQYKKNEIYVWPPSHLNAWIITRCTGSKLHQLRLKMRWIIGEVKTSIVANIYWCHFNIQENKCWQTCFSGWLLADVGHTPLTGCYHPFVSRRPLWIYVYTGFTLLWDPASERTEKSSRLSVYPSDVIEVHCHPDPNICKGVIILWLHWYERAIPRTETGSWNFQWCYYSWKRSQWGRQLVVIRIVYCSTGGRWPNDVYSYKC